MTVAEQDGAIRLSAPCRVDDAEALLDLLQGDPARPVDLTGCGHLPAAIVQLLLAYRPRVTGAPGDPFVLAWIMPLLEHPRFLEPPRVSEYPRSAPVAPG